jgi:hypothetical protein
MAKKDNSKKIMAGFIAFIMISSVFGIIIGNMNSDENNDSKYNGFSYSVTKEGYYNFDVNGVGILFYAHPMVVESFNISNEALSKLTIAQGYYLTFNPEIKELSSVDLVRFDLSQYFVFAGKTAINGISEKSIKYPNMNLIINCQNATQFNPVIMFEDAENSEIVVDEENQYCIRVKSETYLNRIKFRDTLLYRLSGIITE